MKTIHIANEIGRDIRTRLFFRRDVDRLIGNDAGVTLDFAGVVFITRSVADEIYNVVEDNPDTVICGMADEVERMYAIVRKGRQSPRIFPESALEVVQLRTMDELRAYFSTF